MVLNGIKNFDIIKTLFKSKTTIYHYREIIIHIVILDFGHIAHPFTPIQQDFFIYIFFVCV